MSGKVRVPNFTTTEKFHLLKIISNKYASIIEDKKTNRASAEKKENTWQQILRSMVSLKKCYENRNKELRKTLADEKREVTLTGGGPLPKIKRDETDELLMTIIHENTLVGFHNNFDDDADETSIVYRERDENNVVEFYIADEDRVENTVTCPGRETLLPMNQTNQSMAAKKDDDNWRKYNATKLQDPISPASVTNFTTLKNDDTNGNVSNHSKSTPKNRRRPTTIIKSLTSSEIAKKYDLPLDKRLILLEKQLNHMEEENALLIRKRKLEIEILETELLSKKKNVE